MHGRTVACQSIMMLARASCRQHRTTRRGRLACTASPTVDQHVHILSEPVLRTAVVHLFRTHHHMLLRLRPHRVCSSTALVPATAIGLLAAIWPASCITPAISSALLL
jgi:hypothetical protein